jgi:multimeric flavodoxin WrbA
VVAVPVWLETGDRGREIRRGHRRLSRTGQRDMERSKRARRTALPTVRKGQQQWPQSRTEFDSHFDERFFNTEFAGERQALGRLRELAWQHYKGYDKSPRRRAAGRGFAEPSYELPVQWLDTRRAIRQAARTQRSSRSRDRILLICASSRNDKTCPGEMSKTYRLTRMAEQTLAANHAEVDLLDLSKLSSDFGYVIHPCKACVSTAMPLCHWPCSCYPNHALGQVNDWMNEIYVRWTAAHGVMIVTPVYWYQAPSGLKLMIDRLVCADGGNPDPTTTHLKDPAMAKRLELRGWPYPRHLAGRAFAVVVHGDAEGADTLRRSLVDWLTDMELVQAGRAAILDRYVGYYEPYATSHEALDRDRGLHEEVRNAARSLLNEVRSIRSGKREPDERLRQPRPK